MASDNPYTIPDQQLAGPSTTNNTVKILLIVFAALLVLGIMCTGVLAALLLPAVSAARNAARYAQVSNQMKQIGLAMHNYHAAYKQLPPAFAADSEGTPVRSWRVTVTPFAEEQYRWEQWNQDESWDSVANSQLHAPPPFVFISPFDADQTGSVETHVFAVRHPDGLMSGDPQVTFADAKDGLANTILAVYLPGLTTHWAAPEDITLEQLQAELGSASQQDSVIIVFGDGAVRRITSPIDPATVEAMVTRNGGETVAL
jgi:type II secretory pathway pseudopilin PulG